MTDQDSSSYYRPRSPDFSTLQTSFPPSFNYNTTNTSPYHPLTSPLAHRASYDASPFFSPQYQRPVASPSRLLQQYVPPLNPVDFSAEMARRSARLSSRAAAAAAAADVPQIAQVPSMKYAQPIPTPAPPPPSVPAPAANIIPEEPSTTPPAAPIEVKTKFPVARIKRIMQADEDVGKVAQVTPIAVCT